MVGERRSLMGGIFPGEGNNHIFGWWEDSPHPPLSLYIYIDKLCVHHIHHRPKWPSYICKICALCVSQIYMVYSFSCLFSVHNTTNLSYHMFNQAQWWEKIHTTELTTATNKGCIGWLLENYYLMGKKWNF